VPADRREDGATSPGYASDGDLAGNGSRFAMRRTSALADDDVRSPAESEQTAGETDQTLSDADQSASDHDQTSAELDQFAADSDQAASDHDLAAGVNPKAYEFSRGIRRRSAREREQTAQERLQVAEQRDAVAQLRDLAARARDQAADARDLAMAQRDAATALHDDARGVTGIELVAHAAEQRKRVAEYRERAASHRLAAAQDRQTAARDRELAARERQQSLKDREALANQLERAAVDQLTGARTRAPGLSELDHELDRARRTTSPVVVVYVDLVGLKTINDSLGHAAGDALLKRVVACIKTHVRPYDLIIRLGGDEFLCAMSNLTLEDARERFRVIAEATSRTSEPGEIRTGFAQLRTDESADELIARADSELIRKPR
jgi:diguanylate cyclase (GGDEF)-like protein